MNSYQLWLYKGNLGVLVEPVEQIAPLQAASGGYTEGLHDALQLPDAHLCNHIFAQLQHIRVSRYHRWLLLLLL